MSTPVSLSNTDLERLLFAIDTSVRVTKRFQFFLWAQGALQAFLPHETLICVTGDLKRMRVRHEVFSRAVIEPEFERLVGDPVNGFMPGLIDAWFDNGHTPLGFDEAAPPHPALARWAPGHLLAHGAREAASDLDTFFVFVRAPGQISTRVLYLVELLMPHLHMGIQRVLRSEDVGSEVRAGHGILSDREVQVLQWIRDGKTNHEIGQILTISPLTVKNHVQKILRKLNVSNRAQAVAKAATSGIFAMRS